MHSITGRLQNRFRVSAAEVEGQGLWQVCTIGIACVSNHGEHARETVDHAVSYVAENYPDIEILEVQVEVFPPPSGRHEHPPFHPSAHHPLPTMKGAGPC